VTDQLVDPPFDGQVTIPDPFFLWSVSPTQSVFDGSETRVEQILFCHSYFILK